MGAEAVVAYREGVVRRHPLEPHRLTEEITPTGSLIVLAHLGIPEVDPGAWALSVDGLVARPARLSLAALAALPRRRVTCFHECAGNPLEPTVPQRRVVNVVWGGVPLAAVLARVGVHPGARYVWSYGADHGTFAGARADAYVKDLPLDRALAGDVLLADELNGEPLPARHGFPLRLAVPGWYGTNSVKWLTRLHLADRRWDGPFTTRFYADPVPGDPGATAPVWAVAPESVLVHPRPGDLLRQGEEVEVWGRAWGAVEVAGVQVSVDGGATWGEATVTPRRQWSWQRFSLAWRPAAPGPTTLVVRATDDAGVTQPAEGARNAMHRVEVTVLPADP